MAEKLNIKVNVADRPYKLKVKPEEEEDVRKAAKMINDKIMEFQKSYHATDRQDYLAMVALMFTTENVRTKKPVKRISEEASNQLLEIKKMLSTALEEVQED